MAVGAHSRCCRNIRLLLVSCALVQAGWAEQPDNERLKLDHRMVREPVAVASPMVNSEQGLTIIGAALESRHTDLNADCSNLVHEIYQRAGFTYSYANSTELYHGIKEFRRVLHPQPGDLVVWRGHVGILISPTQHSFFSAMRSGRGVEFYDSPYWQGRGQPRFYRYLKSSSRTQLSASARKADSKPSGSTKPGSHELVQADEESAPATGTSSGRQSSRNESASGGRRTAGEAAAPAVISELNPPAMPSPVDTPQAGSLHSSEEHATRDAASGVENEGKPARHKVQNPEDGIWEKPESKPSAGIPFDSVAPSTQAKSGAAQEVVAANIPAPADRTDARVRSAVKPAAREVKPEPTQWAMSRYVPRPPWSLGGGRSSPQSVPRPPAGRTPRAPGFYIPSGQ
jgi:NlpC/P60 family